MLYDPASHGELTRGDPVPREIKHADQEASVCRQSQAEWQDTRSSAVDWEALLARIPGGKTVVHYEADSQIFRQASADALFYLREGKVKLSVTSEEGKGAIIAFLDAGEFFGEGCLAGPPSRMATATTMEASAVTRIAKPLMARMLHDEHVPQLFVTHFLLTESPVRSGSRRSILQFQRTASSPDSFVAGSLRQGKQDGKRRSGHHSGSAGANDWNDPLTSELLHEQVQEARFHQVKWRLERQQRAAQRAVSARSV